MYIPQIDGHQRTQLSLMKVTLFVLHAGHVHSVSKSVSRELGSTLCAAD